MASLQPIIKPAFASIVTPENELVTTISLDLSTLLPALEDYVSALKPYLALKDELTKTYDCLEDAAPQELEELKEKKAFLHLKETEFLQKRKPFDRLLRSQMTLCNLKNEILAQMKSELDAHSSDSQLKRALANPQNLSEQRPLAIDVIMKRTGLDEFLKNTVDAIIEKVVLGTSSKSVAQQAVVTLSINTEGEALHVRLSDNAGGYPENYLTETITKLSMPSEERLRWLSSSKGSVKQDDFHNCYFGGRGLGMRMLFAWMCHGVDLLEANKTRPCYDFSSNPETAVWLSNCTTSDGLPVGAYINLISPVAPLATPRKSAVVPMEFKLPFWVQQVTRTSPASVAITDDALENRSTKASPEAESATGDFFSIEPGV